MTKESSNMLKLITNENLDSQQTDVSETKQHASKVYQSEPSAKSVLLAKFLAFRQSQKKFTIQDLIRDSLK